MTILSSATILRRSPDVRYRILDGEAVVVHQASGEVLGLNEVGARLLDSLDGRRTLGELMAAIQPEYAVEAEVFARDSLAFLAELVAKGVLVAVVTAPGRGLLANGGGGNRGGRRGGDRSEEAGP